MSEAERTGLSLGALQAASFYGMTHRDLRIWLDSRGERAERATAIFGQIYGKHRSPAQLENVSERLRQRLGGELKWESLHSTNVVCSEDGTRKYVHTASDGGCFETVYIPAVSQKTRRTNTLCVSSQTGCAMGCRFCYTASLKKHRNLTAAEIVEQVARTAQDLAPLGREAAVTNIVFMGMGEPLMNTGAVLKAIKILLDHRGFDFSRRRITVSTVGVVPQLQRLADESGVQLAVSLHAPTEALRTRLVPVNKTWPLTTLIPAMRRYAQQTKTRITVEYVLLAGINDRAEDAENLATLLAQVPVKINLLPLNPHDRTPFQRPTDDQVRAFQEILWRAGYSVIVRRTRGAPIAAACGQLGDHQKRLRVLS